MALEGQAVLSGTVRDTTGRSLFRGEMIAPAGGATALTDSSGRYSLPLPIGTHGVRFRLVGFSPATYRVIAADSGLLTLT